MLSKMNGFEAIYLYAGKSDLRKGIDGLAALVKNSSILTLFRKMSSSFFAGPDQTDSKGWSGKAMGSALFTSA